MLLMALLFKARYKRSVSKDIQCDLKGKERFIDIGTLHKSRRIFIKNLTRNDISCTNDLLRDERPKTE